MIDLEVAVQMRREGATFEEIGHRFGVTRQQAYQHLKRHCHTRKNSALMESIPYKGIYDYLMSNPRMTFPGLTYAMLGVQDKASQSRVARFVSGSSNAQLPKRAIDNLIKLTGLRYEELFAEREVRH